MTDAKNTNEETIDPEKALEHLYQLRRNIEDGAPAGNLIAQAEMGMQALGGDIDGWKDDG